MLVLHSQSHVVKYNLAFIKVFRKRPQKPQMTLRAFHKGDLEAASKKPMKSCYALPYGHLKTRLLRAYALLSVETTYFIQNVTLKVSLGL